MTGAAGGVGADRVDAHVRPAPLRQVLQGGDDVLLVLEVERLHLGVAAREVQPVLEAVHGDDAAGPQEPRRLHGEQAHRAGAEHHHRVPGLDVAHLRALVAGGKDVAEEEHLLLVHVVGNLHGPHVREGHAHVLRLAALVAARGVRIPIHARGHLAVGVGVLAAGRQPARAVEAGAARDVEGHHHPVPRLEGAHRGAHLLHHAGELVAEGAPHARVGDEAMEQVQIRAADGRARHPHDGVIGVQDDGVRLVPHRDPVGPLVDHGLHCPLPSLERRRGGTDARQGTHRPSRVGPGDRRTGRPLPPQQRPPEGSPARPPACAPRLRPAGKPHPFNDPLLPRGGCSPERPGP